MPKINLAEMKLLKRFKLNFIIQFFLIVLLFLYYLEINY